VQGLADRQRHRVAGETLLKMTPTTSKKRGKIR
jgi:hypothetical protein